MLHKTTEWQPGKIMSDRKVHTKQKTVFEFMGFEKIKVSGQEIKVV